MTMSQEEWDRRQAAGEWEQLPPYEPPKTQRTESHIHNYVDEALAGLNGREDQASMVDRMRTRFIAGSKVLDLPEPGWVIDNMIPTGSLSLIYGPPKSGKSFIGLDMALSIATGKPWAGHQTTIGEVICVVAEGIGGLSNRVDAWLEHRDLPSVILDRPEAVPDMAAAIWWLTRPINLTDRLEIDTFLDIATTIEPTAIFFDTLARCSLGSEENSAKDMGQVVSGLDLIRDATGAAVIPIHHAGKDITKGARGSSALLGAADAVYEVTGGDGMVHMRCTAMKDSEAPPNMAFKMIPAAGSITLDAHDPVASTPESIGATLRILDEIAPPEGISTSEWKNACADEGISRSVFFRAVKWGRTSGQVINLGTDKRPKYVRPNEAS